MKLFVRFAVLTLVALFFSLHVIKAQAVACTVGNVTLDCADGSGCTYSSTLGYYCTGGSGGGTTQATATPYVQQYPTPTPYSYYNPTPTTTVTSGSSCSYGSYNQCDSLSGSGYQCTPYCYTAGCGGVGKCCPSGTTWNINTNSCTTTTALTPSPTASNLYSCTSTGACGGSNYCCVKSQWDTTGVCQGSCTGTSYPYRKECAYQGQSPDPSQQIACCSGLSPQTVNSCTCPSGTSPTTSGGTCLQSQITICSSTWLSSYENVCQTTTIPTPTPTISQNDAFYCSWYPNLCPTATPIATSTPVPLCDPNHDGRLDISDFNWWKDEFTGTRTTKESDCFKPDGVIDLLDFQVWKNKFLQGTVDAQPLLK